VLSALPSVHVPVLAPWYLPQMPLAHSLELAQDAPSTPSLHCPIPSGSELERTQTSLSQSLGSKHAAPLLPSLQLPTNDLAGRMQLRPASHWALVLHEAPVSPV
jgi:hypothetical protein